MFKIAICDGIPSFIQKVNEYLSEFSKINRVPIIIRKFNNGLKLLEAFSIDKFEIIFLDITISENNGFEIANKIREKNYLVHIIFNTCLYNVSNALRAYACQAYDFVQKSSINYKYINELMLTLCKKKRKHNERTIFIKNDSGIYAIDYTEIIFMETYNKNIMLHCFHEDIICYDKLKDYEMRLKAPCFFRCHTSYIVNFDYIKSVHTDHTIVSNNFNIPISKYRKKEFMSALAHYTGD